MTAVKIALTEAIRQFRAALEQRDILAPERIFADGRLHRCDAEGRNGNGDAAYVLRLDPVPSGGFQNWRDGRGWDNWRADLGRGLTAEEEAAYRCCVKLDRAKQKREDARRKAEASARADTIWREALPSTDHPYLSRKHVGSYGLRVSRAKLLVPVRDAEGKLHSLQFIDATGTKKFLSGSRVRGCFFTIGEPAGVILIGEGYATGASAYEGSGHASVIAFDGGNLKAVATAIRAKFPLARLVLLADDDYLTTGNPGLTKAHEAATAVGGVVAVPDFGADRPAAASDFNDLARHAGPDAVRRCIEATLAANNTDGARPDDDAEIARLAALPALQYERERDGAAERLGCRVSVLDRLVVAARGGSTAHSGLGQPLLLDDIEPWPEPVDGAQLLEDIVTEIRRHVVLSAAAAYAVALWVVIVHAFERFFIFPRLFVTAPEKGCGKTTLLDAIERLVPRPLAASNITAAALFRTIEAVRPTLLLDEADTYVRHNEELRGVLDAGHQRNGAVIRTVGDNHEPRRFSVWAPAAIAAIGHLPGTIEDRSIIVQMRRRRPDERVVSLRLDRASKLDQLARRAARWATDNAEELDAADPAMSATIYNRAADNWRPLLAMADLVGKHWPDRAREAAIELSADGEDAASTKVLLLGDIRDLFTRRGVNVLFTDEILAALHADESRPWPEWKRNKPMTARQLADQLKPFKIKPNTVRRGAETGKGYQLEWFEDAFARYLLPQSVTPSHPKDSAGFELPGSVTPAVLVTDHVMDQSAENSSISAGCDGVTDQKILAWRARI
jgi:putative DNA primase/helicase